VIKMVEFDIITPDNLEEALQLKDKFGREITPLGAGTDIIVAERNNRIHYPRLLNIYNLEELKYIRENNDHITIGSMVTHADIESNTIIVKKFPALAEAVSSIGCPQIRFRGTIAGNVCHASPAADSLAALYVRDCEVLLASVEGSRELNIRDFVTGPGSIAIAPNEIVTGFKIPVKKFDHSFYLSLRQRKSLACNKVSLTFESTKGAIGNSLADISLAFGAVAPTVIKATQTEEFLREKVITADIVEQARNLARSEVNPIDDVRSSAEYRQEMCGVLLEKALRRVLTIS